MEVGQDGGSRHGNRAGAGTREEIQCRRLQHRLRGAMPHRGSAQRAHVPTGSELAEMPGDEVRP